MAEYKLNPPIPIAPCFKCGKPTNETQSIFGVGCMGCFQTGNRDLDAEQSLISKSIHQANGH